MKVLISGSRTWRDREKIRRLLLEMPHHAVVIHGAHWSGADAIVQDEAAKLNIRTEGYPAEWGAHGRSAGPIRNMLMLRDAQPDVVFAFRTSSGESRGTDDLVRKARRRGIPTYMVTDDVDTDRVLNATLINWEQLRMEGV